MYTTATRAAKAGPVPPSRVRLSVPGDRLERAATRRAAEMLGPGAAVRPLRAARTPAVRDGELPAAVRRGTAGPGAELDRQIRATMEPRLGLDLGGVRIHADAAAAESARSLHANAYTVGERIVFAEGRYRPDTESGKQLLAHELAHVSQQEDGEATGVVQRDCSDPTFCTPYATAAEAATVKARLRSYYLPVEAAKFGTGSALLYTDYLSRRPGDSLAPTVFSGAGEVVSSFKDSWATADDVDRIIDLIGARLSRAPGPLPDNVPTTMSVENFLSRAELDDRPIDYGNPFSIAGHIAGGIGSSDAGPDYRKVLWGNATLERVPLVGGVGYTSVEVVLHYEIFDAVDFCPGDCGSPAEQYITIPMSRLEASGEAYDVPFKVLFATEPRSKRFWF